MNIQITTELKQGQSGIEKLTKFIEKKGRIYIDFKKGKILMEGISNSHSNDILAILWQHFHITSIDLSNEKKFKIRNDEKELQSKKEQIKKDISKKPSSIASKVKSFILTEKVFTLTHLREQFPNANFATLRSYVNQMKKENIIVELERGKYSVR